MDEDYINRDELIQKSPIFENKPQQGNQCFPCIPKPKWLSRMPRFEIAIPTHFRFSVSKEAGEERSSNSQGRRTGDSDTETLLTTPPQLQTTVPELQEMNSTTLLVKSVEEGSSANHSSQSERVIIDIGTVHDDSLSNAFRISPIEPSEERLLENPQVFQDEAGTAVHSTTNTIVSNEEPIVNLSTQIEQKAIKTEFQDYDSIPPEFHVEQSADIVLEFASLDSKEGLSSKPHKSALNLEGTFFNDRVVRSSPPPSESGYCPLSDNEAYANASVSILDSPPLSYHDEPFGSSESSVSFGSVYFLDSDSDDDEDIRSPYSPRKIVRSNYADVPRELVTSVEYEHNLLRTSNLSAEVSGESMFGHHAIYDIGPTAAPVTKASLAVESAKEESKDTDPQVPRVVDHRNPQFTSEDKPRSRPTLVPTSQYKLLTRVSEPVLKSGIEMPMRENRKRISLSSIWTSFMSGSPASPVPDSTSDSLTHQNEQPIVDEVDLEDQACHGVSPDEPRNVQFNPGLLHSSNSEPNSVAESASLSDKTGEIEIVQFCDFVSSSSHEEKPESSISLLDSLDSTYPICKIQAESLALA